MDENSDIKLNNFDKEIIKLGVDFWDYLMYGKIEIKNSDIIFSEYKTKTYKLNIKLFYKYFKSTVEKPLKELINDRIKLIDEYALKLNVGSICVELLALNKSILDQLGFNINDYLCEKLNEKKDNTSVYIVLNSLIKRIISKYDSKMKIDIDRNIKLLLDLDIITKAELFMLGYFKDISLDEIMEMRSNGEISEEAVYVYANENIESEYLSKKSKGAILRNSQKRTKIQKLFRLLSVSDIFNLYFLNNYITKEELKIIGINKKEVLELDYNTLLLVLNRQDELPNKIRITSKDIINQYGKTLTGSNIYILYSLGYIDIEDLVDVISINKVLKNSTDFNEDLILEDEEVMIFYDESKIYEMYEDNKLTFDFIKKYNDLIKINYTEEVWKDKSQRLVEIVKSKVEIKGKAEEENLFEKQIFDFYNIGLCDPSILKENLSIEYINEMFLNDELSIQQINRLYDDGIIDDETYIGYFELDELIEAYLTNQIPVEILGKYNNKEKFIDTISEMFLEEKLDITNVLIFYFKLDNISLNFIESCLMNEKIEELDWQTILDTPNKVERLKTLYTNKIIDYNLLDILKQNQLITSDEFDEIKKELDIKEFLDAIKNHETFFITTTRQGNSVLNPKHNSNTHTPSAKSQLAMQAFKAEKKLLSEILEIDFEGNYATIESYNSQGRPTTLNDYQVFASEEKQIAVLRKSKMSNAIYIMPIYQIVYFLNGQKNQNNGIQVNSSKLLDKGYLRQLANVKVVNHSRGMGENITEAVLSLNQDLYPKLKLNRKQYVSQVSSLIQNLDTTYEKYQRV